MRVKDFEKKLGEYLDDSNFMLQGEDGVDLKMLEDLDDDARRWCYSGGWYQPNGRRIQ
jgi:hypothetical protein